MDFAQLVAGMDYVMRHLKARGYAERDIMVDATGGTKPSSMAAAAATFNTEILLQYVATSAVHENGEDTYPVYGYDLHV